MNHGELARRLLQGPFEGARNEWIQPRNTPVMLVGAPGACEEQSIDSARELLRGSGWSGFGTDAGQHGGWEGLEQALANDRWLDEVQYSDVPTHLRAVSAEPEAVVGAAARWTDVDIERGLDALEAAAEDISPELAEEYPDAAEVSLSLQLSNTEARCGRAPDPTDVPDDVIGSDAKTDAWLLRWELEHADPPRDPAAAWVPLGETEPTLVVTPWGDPFSALSLYPLFQAPMPLTLAVLARWHRRHGVVPFTHYLTVLNVRWERRPDTIEEAHRLARETEIVARDTLYLGGETRRQLAFSLLEHPAWHLHSRP